MRIRRSTMGAAWLAVMASSSVVSTVAYAEEKMMLEEVMVTARKKAESLQDVPVSVTALGEQLQRSSLRNLQDIQGFIPNVVIDRVAALQGGAAISIRGISYQETDKSWDAPIGVIVDGVFIGTNSGQLLNNFDIERIEVLRGPQGTLFGKNTNGGAINVIRTAPTKEFGGKVKVSLGDFGREEIQGLVNLPVTDKGGLKLYASKIESDGYIKNTTYNADAGGADLVNIGLTFAYDISDKIDISFTAEHLKDKSEVGAWANFNLGSDLACLTTIAGALDIDLGPVPLSPSPFGTGCKDFDTGSDEDHNSQNAPNTASSTQDFYSLTVNWDIGDWELTSITGYMDRDENPRYE